VVESNRHPDPLEAELTAFRPKPISPGLHSRIDATLAESRQLWRIGAAVLITFAVAACVVIVIGVTWSRGVGSGAKYVNIGTRPSMPFQGNTLRTASPPSLMDYQHAFAESSEAFDALLARPTGSGSAPVRAFSFPSSDSIDINNTGDQR
jgi:hypothetical protein